jgi:hypothetical protein
VYFCVQRFEEREVIVSFVEDHMSCIFVSRGLRREGIVSFVEDHMTSLSSNLWTQKYTTCDPQQN